MKLDDSFKQKSLDSSINFSVEVKITLISKEKVMTIGIDDSVQIFKVERKRLPKANDGIFTLILSKKFGFVSLIPLDILFINPLSIKLKKMELVSSQIDLLLFGDTFKFKYRKRNYLEKAGDVSIYKYFWMKNEIPEFESRRDSIIAVDEVGNEVIVFYNRQTYSTDPWTHPHQDKTDSYKYKKSDSIIFWGYNAMINELKLGSTFTPSSKLFAKVSNNDTPNNDDSLEVIATPLLFKIVDRCEQENLQIFYVYQADLNRDNCTLPLRYFDYIIADEKLGIWWSHLNSFEGYPDRVIGYRDGDCDWGDLSWPPKGLSINEMKSKNTEIYPNPVSFKLTISRIPDGVASHEIFNIFGSGVLSTPSSVRDATPQEGNWEIDVSKLSPGIYFIKIGAQPPLKFIKF